MGVGCETATTFPQGSPTESRLQAIYPPTPENVRTYTDALQSSNCNGQWSRNVGGAIYAPWQLSSPGLEHPGGKIKNLCII